MGETIVKKADTDKIEVALKKWFESTEGQKRIQKAINKASVLSQEIRKAKEVDFEVLNRIMTV